MARARSATLLTALFAICCLARAAGASDSTACEALLPLSPTLLGGGPVTAETLVTLRDIGPGHPRDNLRTIFTLSPDERWIAFQIHRADPVRNRYCAALTVLPLEPQAQPRILDRSDDLIEDRAGRYGWASFGTGIAMPVTPRWGPDGRWIAYLKRSQGSTQVWRVDLDGHAAQATHSEADVEDFRISKDGTAIVYSMRPRLSGNEKRIDDEGRIGWHFDARAFPIRGGRPQTPEASLEYRAVDVGGGFVRIANSDEIHSFDMSTKIVGNAAAYAVSRSGKTAWAEPATGSMFPPLYNLVADQRHGKRQFCTAPSCKVDGSTSLWWTGDGKRLRFTRREGWANSLTAIYEWAPSGIPPRRIFQTSDALIQCEPTADDLICLREGSRQPRHFVRLKFSSGRNETFFDPNPEFAELTLGRVERLHWRNANGVPFYGDLVYPVGFETGLRYPMVIVQYRTRGLLRGGVGDEVPVQLFANRGYFVLSVDNLSYEAIVGRQPTSQQLTTAFDKDFLGRRNILSAIETATQALIDRGFVDKDRIGITGLSDGSTTVQFAALHSSLFSAASIGGCCWHRNQDALLGPMIAERYHSSGWPGLADPDPAFWSQISLAARPGDVRFPILFQAADTEYLLALESYTALAQAGLPTDLYVFPGEEHVKRQPAHRIAIYRRNLAWFDYWLKDISPSDPATQLEVERWAAMKAAWRNSPSVTADEKGDVDHLSTTSASQKRTSH